MTDPAPAGRLAYSGRGTEGKPPGWWQALPRIRHSSRSRSSVACWQPPDAWPVFSRPRGIIRQGYGGDIPAGHSEASSDDGARAPRADDSREPPQPAPLVMTPTTTPMPRPVPTTVARPRASRTTVARPRAGPMTLARPQAVPTSTLAATTPAATPTSSARSGQIPPPAGTRRAQLRAPQPARARRQPRRAARSVALLRTAAPPPLAVPRRPAMPPPPQAARRTVVVRRRMTRSLKADDQAGQVGSNHY